MRMLHGLAHLHKQFQPLFDGEPVLPMPRNAITVLKFLRKRIPSQYFNSKSDASIIKH
jgi:hypothetical protein